MRLRRNVVFARSGNDPPQPAEARAFMMSAPQSSAGDAARAVVNGGPAGRRCQRFDDRVDEQVLRAAQARFQFTCVMTSPGTMPCSVRPVRSRDERSAHPRGRGPFGQAGLLDGLRQLLSLGTTPIQPRTTLPSSRIARTTPRTRSTGIAKPMPSMPVCAAHRAVDADQLAVAVDERAAGIAEVDRGVGLDEVLERRDAELAAAGRADDALRHGLAEPERIADREHGVADSQVVRASERHDRQRSEARSGEPRDPCRDPRRRASRSATCPSSAATLISWRR